MQTLDMFSSKLDVKEQMRFLNRIMGLPLSMQEDLMTRLEQGFRNEMEQADNEGRSVSSGIRRALGEPHTLPP